MRSRRTLHTYTVISQVRHVISGLGRLGILVVCGAPSGNAPVLFPGDCLHRSGRRHHKEVAQVTEPAHTAHLGEGEPFDCLVLIAVPACIVPSGNGVGAHLHHPVWSRRARECLAQAVVHAGIPYTGTGPDERVYTGSR